MNQSGRKKKSKLELISRIIILVLILTGIIIFVLILLSPKQQAGNFPGQPFPGNKDFPVDSPDKSPEQETNKFPATGPEGPRGINIPEMTGINKVSVTVLQAETGTIDEYIKTNGDIITGKSIYLYPDTSGKLVRLHVGVGDHVRKDQIIGEVDPSKPGSVYALNYIKSTITGTVTELPADIGQTVTPQTAIAVVGDLDNLVIRSFVSERYVAKIKTGQVLNFTLEAYPGVSFPASIIEKSPVLDRESRTLEFKAKPDHPDPRIQAGMFPSIRLVVQHRENVIVLPKACIIRSDEKMWVFVAGEDKTVTKRIVTIGLESEGMVEISSGLTIGETVVSRGQYALTDGMTVNIIK